MSTAVQDNSEISPPPAVHLPTARRPGLTVAMSGAANKLMMQHALEHYRVYVYITHWPLTAVVIDQQ